MSLSFDINTIINVPIGADMKKLGSILQNFTSKYLYVKNDQLYSVDNLHNINLRCRLIKFDECFQLLSNETIIYCFSKQLADAFSNNCNGEEKELEQEFEFGYLDRENVRIEYENNMTTVITKQNNLAENFANNNSDRIPNEIITNKITDKVKEEKDFNITKLVNDGLIALPDIDKTKQKKQGKSKCQKKNEETKCKRKFKQTDKHCKSELVKNFYCNDPINYHLSSQDLLTNHSLKSLLQFPEKAAVSQLENEYDSSFSDSDDNDLMTLSRMNGAASILGAIIKQRCGKSPQTFDKSDHSDCTNRTRSKADNNQNETDDLEEIIIASPVIPRMYSDSVLLTSLPTNLINAIIRTDHNSEKSETMDTIYCDGAEICISFDSHNKIYNVFDRLNVLNLPRLDPKYFPNGNSPTTLPIAQFIVQKYLYNVFADTAETADMKTETILKYFDEEFSKFINEFITIERMIDHDQQTITVTLLCPNKKCDIPFLFTAESQMITFQQTDCQ